MTLSQRTSVDSDLESDLSLKFKPSSSMFKLNFQLQVGLLTLSSSSILSWSISSSPSTSISMSTALAGTFTNSVNFAMSLRVLKFKPVSSWKMDLYDGMQGLADLSLMLILNID